MTRSEKRRRRERRRKKQANTALAAASEEQLQAQAVTDPEARAELLRRRAA